MKGFLADLEPYSDGTVSRACRAIRQQERAFPPSAGELVSMCERLLPRYRAPYVALPPHQLDQLPPDEQAAVRARVQAMVDEAKRALAMSEA